MRAELEPLTAKKQQMITAPLLIELCLQTAGVHAIGSTGVMSLPSSIDRVDLYKTKTNGDRLYAEVSLAGCSDCGGFDARVLDEKGNVYLELNNYCTVETNGAVEEDLVEPLRRLVG